MRNLLISLVLCAITGVASAAGCPSTAMVPPQTRPSAELISAAAAQTPLATAAEQTGAVMLPASVQSRATQVMGAPGAAESEPPRHGSRLAMVLAGLGVMLVIVLRWLGASS